MKLEMEVDIEKFRYGLIGNGYIYEEVIEFTEEELMEMLIDKINQKIKFEYRMSRDIIKDKKGVCLEILSKIERG